MHINWNARLLLIAFTSLCLVACGKTDNGRSSQVIVKVNDKEITALQLNSLIKNSGISSTVPSEMRKNAVETLVNQELLVQQAVDSKLDQNPDVMQAVDQARRSILASAAMRQLKGQYKDPSQEVISKFFNDNPALFSSRAYYGLTSFIITDHVDVQLKESLYKANNVAELQDVLTSHGVKFSVKSAYYAAEDIPLDFLSKLYKKSPGSIVLFDVGNALNVSFVDKVDQSPIDFSSSVERIKTYLRLVQDRKDEQAIVAGLRKSASIVYNQK